MPYNFTNLPPLGQGQNILLSSYRDTYSLPYFGGFRSLENIYLNQKAHSNEREYYREAYHCQILDSEFKAKLTDGLLQCVLEFEVAEFNYVQNSKPVETEAITAGILEGKGYLGKSRYQVWDDGDWWYESKSKQCIGFQLDVGGAPSDREKALGAEAIAIREALNVSSRSFTTLWGKGSNLDYRPYRKINGVADLDDAFCRDYDRTQTTLQTLIRLKCKDILEARVPLVRVAIDGRNILALGDMSNVSEDPLKNSLDVGLSSLDAILEL